MTVTTCPTAAAPITKTPAASSSKVERLPNPTSAEPGLVVVDYADLRSGADLSTSIAAAYDFNGLGLLVVRGVPGLAERRERILKMGHRFAQLPEEIKKKTEHEESLYSFGWSHGKEMLAKDTPDFSKGSYYNNPVYDTPFEDEELIKKYPTFCHPNIWPEEMPELRDAFLNMGELVVHVGLLVARQCDTFVEKTCPEFNGRLSRIIKDSRCAKARLLHYFPTKDCATVSDEHDNDRDMKFSSWCGWHNDHGSLTGLVPAMYMSEDGNEVQNPDERSGLYIRSRQGQLVKGVIPTDCLAYQIGETAQIHSGGLLQATPHCVRGAYGKNAVGVSRETFAVFMEPEFDESMDVPSTRSGSDACRGSTDEYLPEGVPILETRWTPSQDFGQFSTATYSTYYDMLPEGMQ